MNLIHRTFLAAATVLLSAPLLHAQVSESAIKKQFELLRPIPTDPHPLPVDQYPATIVKLAGDIRTLPAGPKKVKYADDLAAHLVTHGDMGDEARQAAANALAQALKETPQPAKKDRPPAPYFDLARLVRYMSVKATLDDPLYAKAIQILTDNDAEIEKADFTLQDLNGKKHTLSELRGKIVLINFWATSCDSCKKEMPDLDIIYLHYQSQGLIVLSITSESAFQVHSFIDKMGYHPTVLIDTSGKVTRQFHVDAPPRAFVIDRKGKLVAQSIDQSTQRQFFALLAKTDLQP
jgi:peroxiredoxin